MLPTSGIPATRASAMVAASCRLPKWSTQVTSARRQARPSWSRPCSTTPPTRRTSDAGSTASPSVRRRGARAQGRRRRREQVATVEGGALDGRRLRLLPAQLDHPGDGRLAGGLGRRHQQAVVGPDEVQHPAGGQRHLDADAAACRADPGVDDTEHHAGAEMRHRTHQGVAPGPDVEGRDMVREIDDGRAGGAPGDHRVHHPGELVLRPEVGEEEDRAVRVRSASVRSRSRSLSATGCASVPWRPPPPP